jgi:di/tricarboxylate transporter
LSASILPANVPNLVMAGTAESAFGIHLSYLPYLLLHAPVLGLLKGLALVMCLCLLFPAKPQATAPEGPASPLSPAEKRLGALLITTLALWMTDAVHGISPAWIGLAAACICLLPRIGFLNGDEFAAGVNIRACIHVAGILGLAALVNHSGLGTLLGAWLLQMLPIDPSTPANSFGALVALTSALNFTVTANGVPALYTPLAQPLADASGLPLLTVLMVQVIGYATPLLPYQAAPIVVAMGMGHVPAKDGIRVCLALAAITFMVLVPLDYGWFKLLGLIPR